MGLHSFNSKRSREGRKEVREQLETFLHSFIGGSDSTPANNQGTKARELNPCKKNLAAREDEILLGKFGRRRTTTITSRAAHFLWELTRRQTTLVGVTKKSLESAHSADAARNQCVLQGSQFLEFECRDVGFVFERLTC